VVGVEAHSRLEWSDMPRRTAQAFAIENSREDGGSLTPQSHIGQINEAYICAMIEIKARRTADASFQ
jgi:hypothetical protein